MGSEASEMSGESRQIRVGVLALQGDFEEHVSVCQSLGAFATQVKLPKHMEGLDALILPGGESTAMTHTLISGDWWILSVRGFGLASRYGVPVLGSYCYPSGPYPKTLMSLQVVKGPSPARGMASSVAWTLWPIAISSAHR